MPHHAARGHHRTGSADTKQKCLVWCRLVRLVNLGVRMGFEVQWRRNPQVESRKRGIFHPEAAKGPAM
jgi:hypothetical protein